MRIFFPLFIFLSVNLFAVTANAQSKDKIAIVIDDIGYRATDKSALSLPKQVTFSVLPHTPFGRSLAEQGNKQNREILLHVPMESINNLTLGPGALTANMSEQSVQSSLAASIADIPYVIGVNNHMGSKLTQMSEPMGWTMQFLKDNDLFFLDSKTSQYSQAEYMAQQAGIASLHRNIFLDNEINEAYIEKQFLKLIRMSKRDGIVVAIAHPHPETISVLERMIPLLADKNIELISISEMLPKDHPVRVAQQAKLLSDRSEGE